MKDKSQAEKTAAERQVELLSTALDSAPSAKGYWLNASGKTYPTRVRDKDCVKNRVKRAKIVRFTLCQYIDY